MKDEFPRLFRFFRERADRSRNSLAHEIGVDPSYCTRLENEERTPPRVHVVEAIARGLRLTRLDRNRFFLAAGHAPPALKDYGTWDATLQAVADALTNPRLTDAERAEYQTLIQTVSRHYMPPRGSNGHVTLSATVASTVPPLPYEPAPEPAWVHALPPGPTRGVKAGSVYDL